jgi:hypothetical protein
MKESRVPVVFKSTAVRNKWYEINDFNHGINVIDGLIILDKPYYSIIS